MGSNYTSAVIELLQNGTEPKQVFAGLKTTLAARGHHKLYPAVLRAVARQLPRALRPPATLTVAHERDVKALEQAVTAAAELLQTSRKPIVKIDENLIGGFILEADHHCVDQSHHRKLRSLYQSITTTN